VADGAADAIKKDFLGLNRITAKAEVIAHVAKSVF
jgi:hypothetical protein